MAPRKEDAFLYFYGHVRAARSRSRGHVNKMVRTVKIMVFQAIANSCIILSKGGMNLSMQENLAVILRAYMRMMRYSQTKFANVLEISRSALQSYLKAEGNPSIETVEKMARHMGFDPALLLTSRIQQELHDLLENIVPQMAAMTPKDQSRFIELFTEIMLLLPDTK